MITTTFLIALFFLGKWAWQFVPQYEIEKGFFKNSFCYSFYGERHCAYYDWGGSIKGDILDYYCTEITLGEKVSWYEEKELDEITEDICYIKRKIRVN